MAAATEGANGAALHVAAAKFGWANIQEVGGRKRTTDAPTRALMALTPDQAYFTRRHLTPAEAPLVDAEILFRRTPPVRAAEMVIDSATSIMIRAG